MKASFQWVMNFEPKIIIQRIASHCVLSQSAPIFAFPRSDAALHAHIWGSQKFISPRESKLSVGHEF